MFKTNVDDVYDVVGEGRRVRVVDRRNGAVLIDFTAPRDAPSGLGDAIKRALASGSDDVALEPIDADSVETEPAELEVKKTKKRTRGTSARTS